MVILWKSYKKCSWCGMKMLLNEDKERVEYQRNPNSQALYSCWAGKSVKCGSPSPSQKQDISNQHYHALGEGLTTPISCILSRNCHSPTSPRNNVFFCSTLCDADYPKYKGKVRETNEMWKCARVQINLLLTTHHTKDIVTQAVGYFSLKWILVGKGFAHYSSCAPQVPGFRIRSICHWEENRTSHLRSEQKQHPEGIGTGRCQSSMIIFFCLWEHKLPT